MAQGKQAPEPQREDAPAPTGPTEERVAPEAPDDDNEPADERAEVMKRPARSEATTSDGRLTERGRHLG